jgi:hypothetical protein
MDGDLFPTSPESGPDFLLTDVTFEFPPPYPWLGRGHRNAGKARLLRAMLEHRSELVRWYPHIPLTTSPLGQATPAAALLVLWDRWDYLRGPCPRCGSWALGVSLAGSFSIGRVSGHCVGCGETVSRFVPGSLAHTKTFVQRVLADTPYQVQFADWGWCLCDNPRGLVAVLEELGATGLRERPAVPGSFGARDGGLRR